MGTRHKLINLQGSARWTEAGHDSIGRIRRAVLHGDAELLIDVEQGGYEYSIRLSRGIGDEFVGSWSCVDGGKTETDRVIGRLYKSAAGYFIFGSWHERGVEYYWWMELDQGGEDG